MSGLKRKRLSLREKIEILDFRQNNGNVGVRVLAEKFQVGKTQIADIVSNKYEIYKAWVENGNDERKSTKVRKSEASVIDSELLVWFSKVREKNLPVSGPAIQETAKQIAGVHGLNDFKASNGWLEKFRKRHNISFKSICGESSAVDRTAVNDCKTKLPNIIEKYSERDIFNADETGLFFRVLPNKTMEFKNETCNGGKVSRERLTVLLCCNMIGDFERPLIIGKAKRPRAFKKLDVNKFPVDWSSNKNAWMTTQIMTDWLTKFDTKMIKEKRKVLLFVDNATPHPRLKLKNVELVFFPSNMTSHGQPLDQGIIQQFKKLYRKQLLEKAVADLDAGGSSVVNVLDAVYWVASAQAHVKPETVKKCFLRSGFCNRDSHGDEQSGHKIDTEEQSKIDKELLSLIVLIDSSVDAKDYVTLDENISTHDNDLKSTDEPDEPDEPNTEEEEPSKFHITSLQDALAAVKDLLLMYLFSLPKKHINFSFYDVAKFECNKKINNVGDRMTEYKNINRSYLSYTIVSPYYMRI